MNIFQKNDGCHTDHCTLLIRIVKLYYERTTS